MKRIIDVDLPRTGVIKTYTSYILVEWHFGSSGPKKIERIRRALVRRSDEDGVYYYKRKKK